MYRYHYRTVGTQKPAIFRAQTTPMAFRPGFYLVVDPSYVLSGDEWAHLLDNTSRAQGPTTIRGYQAAAWGTCGDGQFVVWQQGRPIGTCGVDSGTLAFIDANYMNTRANREQVIDLLSRGLATVVRFAGGTTRYDDDICVMHIGNVSISSALDRASTTADSPAGSGSRTQPLFPVVSGRTTMSRDPRALGRRIKQLIWEHGIESRMDEAGLYTWLAGGCAVLALALMEWLGDYGEMQAVYTPRYADTPQHVVVAVLTRNGTRYLDGDGYSTKGTLLRRWREIEHVPSPYLGPWQPVAVEQGHVGWCPRLVKELTLRFQTLLGPPADWGLLPVNEQIPETTGLPAARLSRTRSLRPRLVAATTTGSVRLGPYASPQDLSPTPDLTADQKQTVKRWLGNMTPRTRMRATLTTQVWATVMWHHWAQHLFAGAPRDINRGSDFLKTTIDFLLRSGDIDRYQKALDDFSQFVGSNRHVCAYTWRTATHERDPDQRRTLLHNYEVCSIAASALEALRDAGSALLHFAEGQDPAADFDAWWSIDQIIRDWLHLVRLTPPPPGTDWPRTFDELFTRIVKDAKRATPNTTPDEPWV